MKMKSIISYNRRTRPSGSFWFAMRSLLVLALVPPSCSDMKPLQMNEPAPSSRIASAAPGSTRDQNTTGMPVTPPGLAPVQSMPAPAPVPKATQPLSATSTTTVRQTGTGMSIPAPGPDSPVEYNKKLPDLDTTTPRSSIRWGGKTWSIRSTDEPGGPLANYFDSRESAVRVDDSGALILRIAPQEGIWRAAEVILKRRAGYGTYTWKINSPISDLDPSIVLGLFTYSQDPGWSHREIDIEISAWGDPSYKNQGQFVIQPYDQTGNMFTFPVGMAAGPTTHSFTWLPDRIEFMSWTGHGAPPVRPEGTFPAPVKSPDTTNGKKSTTVARDPATFTDTPGSMIASWIYTAKAGIPKPGNEYVHINLYLMKGGKSPSRGKPVEISLAEFSFEPFVKK